MVQKCLNSEMKFHKIKQQFCFKIRINYLKKYLRELFLMEKDHFL